MTDWFQERLRELERRWRRARASGAFLEVDRVVRVDGEKVKVVATLADATQTAVVYKARETSSVWPHPLSPRELVGASAGRFFGDELVSHFPPVASDCTRIIVGFSGRRDDVEVELAVDRSRTRRFERRSGEVADVVVEGVRLRCLGAVTGVLTATIEVEVSGDGLATASIGRPVLPPAPKRIPMSLPPSSGRASMTFRADPSAPTTEPPRPWRVRALPGGEDLGIDSSSGPDESARASLAFDAPPEDAAALELSLDELFVFRACAAPAVAVPPPRRGEAVDLGGRVLTCGSEGVELLRWEPDEDGTPRLVVCPSEPGLWPDVEVHSTDLIASLWLRPQPDGTLAGGLPGFGQALYDAEVSLVLQSIGRQLEVPPIVIPLTS